LRKAELNKKALNLKYYKNQSTIYSGCNLKKQKISTNRVLKKDSFKKKSSMNTLCANKKLMPFNWKGVGGFSGKVPVPIYAIQMPS
jgi:hypothetical protein